MKTWIKYFVPMVATACITSAAFSQEKNDKSTNNKENQSQEIVIRKKGGKAEKMTIVVDGDNITINGKPAEEFKNNNVIVIKRDREAGMFAGPRPSAPPRPRFDHEDFEGMFPASNNRAVLGVLTSKSDDGVKLSEVTKESGAEKAGLKKDDVITKVGNKEVKDPSDLVAVINTYKPNDKVEITYKRDGKETKTSAVLGENKSRSLVFNKEFRFEMPEGVIPPMQNFNFNFNKKPKIGLQVQDIEEGKGVIVKDVDENSPAAKAGIKDGDVIMQVDGKDVNAVDELRAAVKDVKEGETVKFTLKRNGKSQTSEIKIPKKLKTADL